PAATASPASAAAAVAIGAMTTATRTILSRTVVAAPGLERWHSRPHSQAITAAATAVTKGSQGRPNPTPAIGTGANAHAETTRCPSLAGSARADPGTVPPLAPAIFIDRPIEIALGKIRP